MDAYCTRCKVLLEESDFDHRIGECPKCGRQYTDKKYKAILKSAQGYDNKSLDVFVIGVLSQKDKKTLSGIIKDMIDDYIDKHLDKIIKDNEEDVRRILSEIDSEKQAREED